MDFVVIGAEAFLYRAFPRGLRQRHRICEVRKKGETKKKRGPLLWLGHATNWGGLIEIYHSYICLVEVIIIIYIDVYFRFVFCIILFCFSCTSSINLTLFQVFHHLAPENERLFRRWNRRGMTCLLCLREAPRNLENGETLRGTARSVEVWWDRDPVLGVGPAADSWTLKMKCPKNNEVEVSHSFLKFHKKFTSSCQRLGMLPFWVFWGCHG